MNGKWISAMFRDEHFAMNEGFRYECETPEGLTKAEEQVWNDLCNKAHIIPELLNKARNGQCPDTYRVIHDKINDSCLLFNLAGPRVIRYEVLITHFMIAITEYMSQNPLE
jgi:hypothetical protein